MMEAPTGPPPADARDAPGGGGTRWKGTTYWYDRGMPRLPAMVSPEAARRSRRRKMYVAVVCVLMFIIPALYVATFEHGKIYTYDYSINLWGVNGTYQIIVPIALLVDGGPLPYVDLEDVFPGRCTLEPTEHGLGLSVSGDGPMNGTVQGEYNACVHSQDHVSDGNPVLSMSTFTTYKGLQEWESAWVWVNSTGSVWMELMFSRDSDDWYGNRFGGINQFGGGSLYVFMRTVLSDGWTEAPVDIWWVVKTS